MDVAKPIRWSIEKNAKLRAERGIGFEEIETAILNDKVLEVIDHSNTAQYGHQKIFVIDWNEYALVVPYVETENEIFLKTAFYSRKATKKYFRSTK
jgi:hypothetical protein